MVEAARPVALRVRVINESIRSDVPAQICPAQVSGGCLEVRILRIDVRTARGQAGAEVGGGGELLAAEAAEVPAERLVVHIEVADAAGDLEHLGDDVEAHRSEHRLLDEGALEIVDESD